jgi:hypothetical protein
LFFIFSLSIFLSFSALLPPFTYSFQTPSFVLPISSLFRCITIFLLFILFPLSSSHYYGLIILLVVYILDVECCWRTQLLLTLSLSSYVFSFTCVLSSLHILSAPPLAFLRSNPKPYTKP